MLDLYYNMNCSGIELFMPKSTIIGIQLVGLVGYICELAKLSSPSTTCLKTSVLLSLNNEDKNICGNEIGMPVSTCLEE